MKTLGTLCVFAAVVCAAPAFAADKPVKVVVAAPAPVVVPVYNWRGVYFGLDAGGQRSRIDVENPLFPTFGIHAEHSSFIFSAHAGLQYQFDRIVVGLEGGWNWTGQNSSNRTCAGVPVLSGAGGPTTCQARFSDFGNVGPRLGVAFNNWLPYLSGGYAHGHAEFNANNPTTGTLVERGEQGMNGWYLGGGLEWASLRHVGWVAGIDYRHYRFDNVAANGNTPQGVFKETINFHPTTDVVSARLSYKFRIY